MMKTLKKVSKTLRRKKSDRVYVFDEEVEAYRKSRFIRFYSAIGFIHAPKREKYDPEKFPSTAQSPRPRSPRPRSPRPRSPCNTIRPEQEEEEVEVVTLGRDLPPRPEEGEPWDPLPVIIAWEYPEEDMPVFLDFHYLDRGF